MDRAGKTAECKYNVASKVTECYAIRTESCFFGMFLVLNVAGISPKVPYVASSVYNVV